MAGTGLRMQEAQCTHKGVSRSSFISSFLRIVSLKHTATFLPTQEGRQTQTDTDRQTETDRDRQTDRERERQTYMHADKDKGIRAERQTGVVGASLWLDPTVV